MSIINKNEILEKPQQQETNRKMENKVEEQTKTDNTKTITEEYRKVKLLLIKKHKLDEMDKENDEPEINTLLYIEEIVDH